MGEKYQALVEHLGEITNINRAEGLLGWDQQVNMPPGGAGARARQIATLARIGHEMFVDERTARLLEDAEREIAGMPYDSDEASLVRVVREDYRERTRLPSSFVAEYARATSEAHEVWAHARENNTFATFRPALEHIVELVQQMATYLGYSDHPYDALLGQYERGITTAQVKQIFDGHKPRLVALIAAISKVKDRVSDALVHQPYDTDKQRLFAMEVVQKFGYDMQRGHQAVAVHPFMSGYSTDARITTRFNADWLNPALFGMMHEAGHAMYEQGVGKSLEGSPLEAGTSLGVHESQSRMWENMIGRSRGFWKWAFPRLQGYFPEQLGSATAEDFYRAVNKVEPSLIRVEADEATYNLHIMLRFEIEMGLLSGEMKVADLPEAWNELFHAYFGITPPSDTLGVLQDIHWSAGLIGYFPTYALGNLLAAQYYNKAVAQHPSIPDEISAGEFDTLRRWLNENIHVHGRKFTSDELTRKVCGEGINADAYIAYLEGKFGDLYGL
jgi:carboxypeptidase Taq